MDSRLLNFLIWTLQSLVALSISNWIVYDFSITFFLVSILISSLNGLLFVWLIKKAQYRLYKGITIESIKQEDLIADTASNLFLGKLAVGGKLALTNDKLVFKPHKFNFLKEVVEIKFTEIRRINVSKSLGIVNNKLSIIMGNRSYQFLLNEPQKWEGIIRNQMT